MDASDNDKPDPQGSGNGKNDRANSLLLVKPSSAKELSVLYGIQLRTFHKWLAPFKSKIGEPTGRFYNVRQVKIIYRFLGPPCLYFDTDLDV